MRRIGRAVVSLSASLSRRSFGEDAEARKLTVGAGARPDD